MTDTNSQEIFALILDGKVLTSNDVIKFKRQRGDKRISYRTFKKTYLTLAQARRGLAFVPDGLRDRVEIHKYTSIGKV